jgi:hypothetical protein
LAYYSIDVFLGSYLKDRIDSSRQRLVVYDRCFLDMAVDPVRYGLSSGRGVLFVWRLLPKPNLIIMLEDDPERIYGRKPEIAVGEIGLQLDEWRSLLRDGHVQASVRVDSSPGEIGERVLRLVVDEFLRINGHASRTGPKKAQSG